MPTIKELAPTLVSIGIDEKELKKALRPTNPKPAIETPVIAPKRYKMVFERLLAGQSIEMAAANSCVPLSIAITVKAEMDAVTDKLSKLTPVNYDAVVEDDIVDPEKG